jgi:hypothetical protein
LLCGEGHLEAVQFLLDADADPEWNGPHDGGLIAMAAIEGMPRSRGFWKKRGHVAAACCPDPTAIPFMPRSLATTRRKSAGCSRGSNSRGRRQRQLIAMPTT